MAKQLIFIDDSDDPGFKSDSSTNFVMAAALFIDQKEGKRYKLARKWHKS